MYIIDCILVSKEHTVAGAVTNLNSLSLILELGDGNDGTEDLLLGNLHVGSNVGEDGGLDEVTLSTVALTTESNSGTLVLAVLNVLHDTVELELRDLGTLEGVLGEGVTQLVLGGTLLEALNELVVDTLLDQQARTGTAALAVVVEDTKVGPGDGVINVGIVEDNVGGLATELEGDLLQVGLGGGLEDHTANKGRTGEGNLVNVHVGRDGSTGGATETGDDVDDTGGEAGLDDEVASIQTGERSLLGGLDDDGVTGSDSRTNLPGPHEEGEVPGDDLTADTDGLVAGVGESLGVGVDGLTGDLVGPATVVAQAAGGIGNVALGHGDGLAVVESLDGGEDLDITLEQIGQLGEHTATVGGGHVVPGTLEGGASGLDGDVDILLGGLVDGGDDLFVGGVDGLEGLALDRLDELVVDEPVEKKEEELVKKLCIGRERLIAKRPENRSNVQAERLLVGDVGGLDGSGEGHGCV